MTVATAIAEIIAWESLDSRGRPTVACRVVLGGGASGMAIVPSGASAGSHEAVELRDGGSRFGGKGVLRAVGHVNTVLAPLLRGSDVSIVNEVDSKLAEADTSPGYSRLGANALLAVSLASERAAAQAAGVTLARWLAGDGPLELPMPMVNIISGGAHAGGILDIQDFLVIPVGAESFAEAIRWCAEVRTATQRLAVDHGFSGAVLVADEGGLALPLSRNRDALEILTRGIEAAGLDPWHQVRIAIDVAASEFFRDGEYRLAAEDRKLDSAGLIAELVGWCDDFAIASIEDALSEDDWEGWEQVTRSLGGRIELVGDDLFATNESRLVYGISRGVANSVLIKVNQNGLVSGTRKVLSAAKQEGYRTVVSARSGDTEDSWLADLAVGWGAGQIKVGSTHRSERTAKWNRLLEFEATEDTTFAHFPSR